MNNIISANPLAHIHFNLNPRFVWKSAKVNGDQEYHVKDMATSHLFYTLRMIWNHRMPQQYHLHPYKQYELMYNDHYLTQAIYAIAGELSTRKDIAPEFKRQLQVMASYFNNQGRVSRE